MRTQRRTSFWDDRIRVLSTAAVVACAVIVVRIADLQILRHGEYVAQAEGQHNIRATLTPTRGEILVRDRFSGGQTFPLATNRTYHLLFAVPKDVPDPLSTARALDPHVTLDEATLLTRLSRPGDIYEPLQHAMTNEEKATIEALALAGIQFHDEELRYYPEGAIGSHVLGFVGYQDDIRQGQYGIEGAFEKLLAGKAGLLNGERDARGKPIVIGDREFAPSEDGAGVVLTLDRTIQYETCTKLDAWVLQHGASGGSVVILNPKTGAVLAMCGTPDFDPNRYSEEKDITVFANPATFATYEPGSVFKPLTMAAAIDVGKVTPTSTYIDTGEAKYGRFTIRNSDSKAYGEQTMTQVLQKSLNTGAIFAAQQLGNETFEEYVKAYGFGTKTDIEISGEQPGNISTLRQKKDIYTATASFGQGISVTPLQLAAAYGVIANGGKLMRPYIVESITRGPNDTTITEPRMVRQVVSPQTAATVGAMLVRVVQDGHGQRAGVPGYFVAGKTGTAQIPSKDARGYEAGVTIGTFAGFAPVSDPQFVMVVRVDRPRDVEFAESSAAPLFGQLASFLLHYLEVPPSAPVSSSSE